MHDGSDFPVPTGARGACSPCGGLRLWCFDTFGLVARLVAVGPSATVTVHPVPTPVELGEELLRGRPEHGGQPAAAPWCRPPRVTASATSPGIRPYVPGDRLRLLYWPALARTRRADGARLRGLGAAPGARGGRLRPLSDAPAGCESVLATAAGVGLAVLARGSVVELSTTAGERIAVGPGPLGRRALLRAIAAHRDPAPRRHARRRLATGGRHDAPAVADGDRPPDVGDGNWWSPPRTACATMPGALGFAHLVIAP